MELLGHRALVGLERVGHRGRDAGQLLRQPRRTAHLLRVGLGSGSGSGLALVLGLRLVPGLELGLGLELEPGLG